MGFMSLGAIGFAVQVGGLSNASGGTVVPPSPGYWALFSADAIQPTVNYKEIYDGWHRSLHTQLVMNY